MNTTKKWLLFWSIFAAVGIGTLALALSGNFPQFTIPFSVFASEDQTQKKKELPKLKILALKDLNDQSFLEEQTNKVDALNKAFSDSRQLASSQSMASAIETVYGKAADRRSLYELYRTIYPSVSSRESGFVSVQLIGYGQQLVKDQPMTTQRQLWSFADINGNRSDYTVSVRYNNKGLDQLSVKSGGEASLVITKDDTYLDKTADFETDWTDLVQKGTDTKLYRQMKKAGMDQNQTEFKSLEKSITITNQEGFFDLFKATQGDLTHAYLSGFYHTNTPTDGQSDYYFRVPTSETKTQTFIVVYDRLQQKLVSITKE